MSAQFPQTPSQTVGPFFHYGLVFPGGNIVASDEARGQPIAIEGRVLDGAGQPVPDAMVELWQPDASGVFPHSADPRHASADPAVRGFGRSSTTYPGNRYRFHTVKPGPAPAYPEGPVQAPHVCLRIFARGLLVHLTTRLYFDDETAANATDAVLAGIDPNRRATLVAHRDPASGARTRYNLDLVLQGPGETVFFQA